MNWLSYLLTKTNRKWQKRGNYFQKYYFIGKNRRFLIMKNNLFCCFFVYFELFPLVKAPWLTIYHQLPTNNYFEKWQNSGKG